MMLHPMVKRSIPLALSAALLVGTVPPGFVIAAETPAASTAPAVSLFQVPSVGRVSLGGTSYIELKNVQQLGTSVRFTLSMYNGGSSDLQFINYWVKMRSAGGSQFSPKLIEADADKNSVSPKSTETFTFTATVNESIQLTDLIFDVIVWDFNATNFQRTLGTLKITSKYQPSAPAGAALSTTIGNVPTTMLIERANVAKTSEKYVASLSMKFTNTGTKSYVIPKYTYSIVTSEGLSYPLKVSGLPDNTTLTPRFSEQFTLSGELPASLSPSKWRLVISENVSDTVTVPFASFFLPASSTSSVSDSIAYGSAFETLVSDQTVETKVTRAVRNENDVNYLSTINVTFVNKGTDPIALPKYEFEIRTAAGLTYPATVDLSNVRLDPLVEKEVVLKATIPVTADSEGWKLVLNEPVDSTDEDSEVTELALFDLPDANATGLTPGSTYSYTNENGTYDIQFVGMQRLPWEDQDILSAEFSVKNNSSRALPIPSYTGHFLLDDNIEVEAAALTKDALVAIPPGGSVRVSLYGKIPYTYTYSSIRTLLEEEQTEDTTVSVTEFSAGTSVAAIPDLALGSTHRIEGAGRQAGVSIRTVRTYEGADGNNLFTVLVDVKNLERRATGIVPLVAHLRTADGMLYPVEFSEFSGKVAPQATTTLIASAVVPTSIQTRNLDLILGEGIRTASDSSGATPDAYINAISFDLPTEPAVKSNGQELTLFPYTVTIEDIVARLDTADTFLFSFDYEVQKNTTIQNANDYEHELTVELVSEKGTSIFEKTFTLGTKDSEEDDTQLELGSGTKLFEEDGTTVNYLTQYEEHFEIRIYDEFDGARKLIATIPYNWYIR